jgi:chromosome segregation ATPase
MSNMINRPLQIAQVEQSQKLDALEGELSRNYAEQVIEIENLRESNTELFEQLTDLKKRNLELSSSEETRQALELQIEQLRITENTLRIDVALRDTTVTDYEKKLSDARAALAFVHQQKEDLTRKLVNLTDESWEKDLEIESLLKASDAARAHASQFSDEAHAKQSELEKLLADANAENQRAQETHARVMREAQQAHMHESESMQETNSALRQQLSRLTSDRTGLENQLNQLQELNERFSQTLIAREIELERLKREQEEEIGKLNQAASEANSANEQLVLNLASANDSLSRVQIEFDQEKTHTSLLQKALEVERKEKEESKFQFAEMMQKRKLETDDFNKVELELQSKIDTLEGQSTEQIRQLEQASELVSAFEQELESCKSDLKTARISATTSLREARETHGQQVAALRSLESQLNGEINGLRAERASLEKSFNESSESVIKLRAALEAQRTAQSAERRHLEQETERRLAELKARLETEFQKRFEVVLVENNQIRKALNTHDTSIETERKNLQKWQIQLNIREQQLRQTYDTAGNEKAEILRMSKQLANELHLARSNHPLKDYLELTEIELSKLQSQIKGFTSPSPERNALEKSFAQMTQQRNYFRSVLASSQRQLEERAHSVMALAQSAVKA